MNGHGQNQNNSLFIWYIVQQEFVNGNHTKPTFNLNGDFMAFQIFLEFKHTSRDKINVIYFNYELMNSENFMRKIDK